MERTTHKLHTIVLSIGFPKKAMEGQERVLILYLLSQLQTLDNEDVAKIHVTTN